MTGALILGPVDKTFDEAMTLLIEARDPAARGHGRASSDTKDLRQIPRSFRITARLGEVVAWIMARRAVRAGEITEEEGRSEKFRLSATTTCLASDDDGDAAPDELRRLSRRSLGLYRRIVRLDSLIGTPA